MIATAIRLVSSNLSNLVGDWKLAKMTKCVKRKREEEEDEKEEEEKKKPKIDAKDTTL